MSKWKQVVFVVSITVATYFYNRQRSSFYTFEPPLNERIPCAAVPSMTERKEDCEKVMCMWKEAGPPYPRCFQPTDYYGYRLLGSSALDEDHVTLNLTYAGAPYSPYAEGLIPNVQFSFTKYHNRIARFKFSNADERRYEVPMLDNFAFIKRAHRACNPQYSFKMGTTKGGYFYFSILRRHTEVKLIDTRIGGLVMTNQFLQFVTYLPSKNLYGFGELSHTSLRHNFDFSTHAMFARDQAPKDGANLYGVHPFYLCVEEGGKAHGLLLLNSNAMEYTLLDAPALRLATIGGVLDFFLFVGDSPKEVIELYTSVIGRPFLPPYWALGFQLSRYGHESLERLKAVLERNRNAGFPVDVQHLDIDYMDEAAPFTVNATTYSGLGEFLAEQREKYGLRFVVNLSPALPSTLPEYEPFRRGSQHKAFVTYSSIITLEGQSLPPVKFDTHNVVFGILWPCSPVAYVDFFKNTTISWWTKELAYMHKTLPFDGIWLISANVKDPQVAEIYPEPSTTARLIACVVSDMNEPSEFSANRAAISAERRKNCFKGWKMTCQATIYDDPPYPTKAATQYGPEARLSDRTLCMTGRFGGHKGYWHYDVHNLYGLSQARATHIALEELLPERKLIISRSTYPSSGRYGGHWLGDNQSSWGHLYRSIIGMLEFNMFGIPYVGADICGFFGDTTEDLCVRWMQLGAFYPFCRSHNDMSAMAQDPAVFSQEAQAVMRKALHTRYTLLPFLYTLFFNAHINGTPVVRPLFFEFPHDSHTYGIRTQFMWGSSLLISPITKNRTYMSFYIPAGLWYNYYQNTPFLSSGEYMVHNWLTLQTSTPLYVKAGSILPTQRYYNHSMKPEDRMCQPLSLVVYADNAGNSVGTLFWDDGVGKHNIANETYDYFRFTTVDCHLTLWRLHKSTRPVPFVIQSVVLVGQKKPPLRMYVDGRKKSNAISQMADKTYELNVQLSLHLDSKDHTIEWTS